MAVTDLHDAAKVLDGAHRAITALLAEVEPQYREACRAYARFEKGSDFHMIGTDEHRAAYAREVTATGFDAFNDAAYRLATLLETVDDIEKEEENKIAAAA